MHTGVESPYAPVLSFLVGTHLGAEWLDHMVGVCLTFQQNAKLFPKLILEMAHFTFPGPRCPRQCLRAPIPPHPYGYRGGRSF